MDLAARLVWFALVFLGGWIGRDVFLRREKWIGRLGKGEGRIGKGKG